MATTQTAPTLLFAFAGRYFNDDRDLVDDLKFSAGRITVVDAETFTTLGSAYYDAASGESPDALVRDLRAMHQGHADR